MKNEDAPLDLAERGRTPDGSVVRLDRRLFFQLHVVSGCRDIRVLSDAMRERQVEAVLYESLHDPRGAGVLTLHEDPERLMQVSRQLLNTPPFADLALDARFSMVGRTYSIGYERDLEDTLLHRPRARVFDPALAWAVWYPLRRRGSFERLSSEDQRAALMEHADIGQRFGRAGHAQDIRLACHGLDPHDNDFVVGLVGASLSPLSAVVQAMRSTVQTSEHIERMGPFFVGRAVRREVPQ